MTYVREKHSETTLKSSFHNNNMQLKAIGKTVTKKTELISSGSVTKIASCGQCFSEHSEKCSSFVFSL